MTSKADEMLEQQLKVAGKQLSRPSNSVDKLLRVLDQVENLLLMVDQSPKKSMLDALKPLMKALIHNRLSKHSDINVKVAVASCISEITRITAPDAPYTNNQMRDVFHLTVSCFEDLADQFSRSYNKRASVLETVSRVKSCVIMLDLDCDELVVEMFEIFLKSVRDYHPDFVFSSMENIMVLLIKESAEISVEMLKPLLARVRKDPEGILPVAHRLGKGVILKSADKLKPYMMPALTSLGESLDMYHGVVAAVCEGTTVIFENNGDNDSVLQLANECKLEKESIDEAHQVAKEEACAEDVDPTVKNKSPKSVLSNRVNVTVMKDASVDQEPRKSEKDKSQEPISKEDTDDSHADKLVNKKSITEKTSKRSEKKADNDVKELENKKLGDNEVKKPENQNEEDNDVKEIENQNEADIDVKEPENKNEEDNDVKETENVSLLLLHMFKSFQQEAMVSKQQPAPQEDDTACLSKSGSLPGETRMKKVGLPKNKSLTQEDTPEAQNQAGKKMVISKEVKLPDTVNKSEDGVLCSDPDANLLKGSSKLTKRKLVDIMNQSEAKLLKKWSESTKQSVPPLNLAAKKSTLKKKVDVSGSDAKSLNMSVKKGEKSKITVEVEEEFNPDGKPLNLAASISTSKKKVEVSGSDAKSLKISVKKGEKSKIAVEEEEEYNSDSKRSGNGKNVAEKDQAKSLSGDDEMDTSSKSATKSAKGEGSSTKTLVTSAKRKHDTHKDEVTIKYDESLVGTKVKVWWPVDEMYYEGVVEKYYPDEKKHKISYVDGDTEVLSLKTQNWEILQEFSVRDYKGQNTKAQIEEASLEIHKEKKSKTHPSMSQEKIKDSANKFQKTMDTPSKYTLYTEEDMMTSFPAELRQKLFESVQVKPFNVRQAWSEVPLEEVLAVAPKKATLKELFFFTMLAGGALPANAVKIMNTIEEFIQTEMDDLANNIRVEEIVESDDKVIEVMGNEDAGVVKTSVTTCEADVNMDRSACKPSQIATDNLEHGLQFTLHGGMPISQPPQEEHPQHESQQQSQRQPHHQPFDVRHPSLPPCIEDVLHDHTHRLQKMENLIQWSVKLQIERARADGFPIPPLPSHSKDTLDPPL